LNIAPLQPEIRKTLEFIKLTNMKVLKFGGTSLEGRERIFAAARIITQAAKRGSRVVAVVSAQGQTTDDMIAQAISIHPRVTAREMDAYLSTGEQVSAGLLAMAIQAMGYPVVSLTGRPASTPTAPTEMPEFWGWAMTGFSRSWTGTKLSWWLDSRA
jgi:aspartokinase